MDVKGEGVRVWVNERQRKDGGTWKDYSVGISKKEQDDTYTTAYVKCRFTKDVHLPDVFPNGMKMDFSGFLSVDKYTDKDGKEVKRPMIVVTKADFEISVPDKSKFADVDADSFNAAEEDIPF